MKTKTLEVACERCGTPLVVGRREEWKDKIKVGLHPCAWCLANPPVGDPRWDAALNALRAERNGPPLPVPPPPQSPLTACAAPSRSRCLRTPWC